LTSYPFSPHLPLTPKSTTEFATLWKSEPQIDKENGGALGILSLNFDAHEKAKDAWRKSMGEKMV